MTRPLRSLLIGDVDYYPSEYIFGVAQGMTLLGHWHTSINLRAGIDTIAGRIRLVRPDVLWGHMLLWPPAPTSAVALLDLCEHARKSYGTKVLIHDGDARPETRWPHDISSAVDLALCNHTAPRAAWNIPTLRWPYGAFVQAEPAQRQLDLACDLFFAGRLGEGIYRERSMFVETLRRHLGPAFRAVTSGGEHTLFRTPEVSASANAILGWGRPEASGWIDVRVFQYPGAGGVLLHDDAGGYLEPDVHYLSVQRGDVDSVLAAIEVAKGYGPDIRDAAFTYVQGHHTWTHRVLQALEAVDVCWR